MMNKRVMLIELAGIHYEVVHSHILCLREAGYRVDFVCYRDIEQYPQIYASADTTYLLDKPESRIWRIMQLVGILGRLIRTGCRDVVVATADSGVMLIRILLLLLMAMPIKLNVIRCIHNLKPLRESWWERGVFRRAYRKYLVLNDYLVEANRWALRDCVLTSFYPIFYPSKQKVALEKKDGDLWICIPGYLNFDRKDYVFLLEKMEDNEVDGRVKFVLLGGGKKESVQHMKSVLEDERLLDHFILLEQEFVDNNVFYSYIDRSDFIMPLVHPSNPKYSKYLRDKISGAFNLAFGFRKPLLCDERFKGYRDFDENAIFYSNNDVVSVINRLACLGPEVRHRMYTSKKWTLSYQAARYRTLIESGRGHMGRDAFEGVDGGSHQHSSLDHSRASSASALDDAM